MNVAIVNDSRIAAEVLRRILAELPNFTLIWTAFSGEQAINLQRQNPADIILMDLIMPGIGGAETTRRIMRSTPAVILVVTATTVGNRDQVFEAMGHGALDAVNTPTLGAEGDMRGAEPLLQKLRMVARLVAPARNTLNAANAAPLVRSRLRDESTLPIVAIGASTGGPQALAEVIRHFPANFPAAVLIVQHVDEHFAPGLAIWLQHHTPLPVHIACDREPVLPGNIFVAGGKDHLVYAKGGILLHTPDPVDTPYRPSVDALFQSLAHPHRAARIGVLLTGMGRDGAAGLLALRKSRALTIAQDAESCVVYGMPKAAAEIEAAQEILPLTSIGHRLCEAILQGKGITRHAD